MKTFKEGQRVKTIYGNGTVTRVLMSGHGDEAWVNLDTRPDEQHCSFEKDDPRANHVRCVAGECEAL